MRDMRWCDNGKNPRVADGACHVNPILRPGDDIEASRRQFVQALQSCGAGEVIGTDDRDLAGPRVGPEKSCSRKVCVRVHNEGLWYAVVAEVATAVRTVPGVTMVLRLDQVSELDLDVPPWIPPGQRSLLLNVALGAATHALLSRKAIQDQSFENSH
jgi:hypothetical protein